MVTLSQEINLLHVMIEMQGWAIQKHLSHFRAQLIKFQNNLSSFVSFVLHLMSVLRLLQLS